MAIFAILIAALLFLVVAAAGFRIVRFFLPESDDDERLVLGFPIAMAILSVVTMILLFARLPAKWGLGGVIVLAWFWTRRERRALLQSGWSRLRNLGLLSWPARVYGAIVLVAALLGVIGCLAPETGWDTGVYHFTMARLRAEEGSMVVRPDIPHGYRPAYMEMLYTAGFLLSGETLASLMNFAFWCSGLGLARLWAGRLGGGRAGLLAGFAYLTSFSYALRMGGGDVEVGQAVYLGLAMYSLWRLREGGGPRWRVMAGVGLGLLLGVKYPSAWAILALAVTWLVLRLKDRAPLRTLAADAGILGALCVVIASPWYIRNALAVGNPFHPFGVAALGGSSIVGEGAGEAFWKALAMDVFILGAFPACAVFAARRVRWVAVVAVLFFLLLVRQVGTTEGGLVNALRYATPGFLGLLVLGALGVDEALRRGLPLRIAAAASLILPLGVTLGVHGIRNGKKALVAIGVVSREAYLTERINSYWAIRRAEGELVPGRKILLLEQRAYYCRTPFLTATDIQSHIRWEGIRTSRDLRDFLETHSIAFIVLDPAGKSWNFQAMARRSPGMLKDAGVKEVETRNGCTLYRVVW
jgi:hypothetical protein